MLCSCVARSVSHGCEAFHRRVARSLWDALKYQRFEKWNIQNKLLLGQQLCSFLRVPPVCAQTISPPSCCTTSLQQFQQLLLWRSASRKALMYSVLHLMAASCSRPQAGGSNGKRPWTSAGPRFQPLSPLDVSPMLGSPARSSLLAASLL